MDMVKLRCSALAVVMVAGGSPTTARAEQPTARGGPATSGAALADSYLDVLPSVEEVRRRVVGADGMDTAARQLGAFRQLAGLVRALCDGGEMVARCTAKESAANAAYSRAALAADRAGEAMTDASGSPAGRSDPPGSRWTKVRLAYDNEGFRQQLLELFSPRLRDLYHARYPPKPQAVKAADPIPRAPGLPEPEPGLAAARKAGLTKVFGIPLIGERMQLPKCEGGDASAMARSLGVHPQVAAACWLPPGAMPLTIVMGGITIEIPARQRPSWVHSVTATLDHEVVVAVAIATVQDDAAAELKQLIKKYGAPNRKDDRAVEWLVKGIHVQYAVRPSVEVPSEVYVTSGIIGGVMVGAMNVAGAEAEASMPNLFIETERRYRARQAAAQQQQAEDPEL